MIWNGLALWKSGFRPALFSLGMLWMALGAGAAPGGGTGARPRAAQDADSVTVFTGGRQLMEYRRIQSPNKPYVRKLFSPGGIQVLRDGPSDHKHHHALMFALAAGGVNFWEERDGSGIERPRSIKLLKSRNRSGMTGAGFTQSLDWVEPRGMRPLLSERRTVEVYDIAAPPATLLVWRSRIESAGRQAPVALGGSHYFGLGMRLVESMDRGGRFFNADQLEGDPIRGTERLTRTRWCAYAASADGRPVTVAIFDHPSNVRHPARMFTMTAPFAYLAATLNLWKEPLTLEPVKPLDLVYGIAVWDGTAEAAQIEALYRLYVD